MKCKCEREGWNIKLDERRLSVIVFALFSSWMLAFPFEGQILYSMVDKYHINPHTMIFSAIAIHFAGLFLCGFVVKTMDTAKSMMVLTIVFCIVGSCVFFFNPSILWIIALISCSFLAGGYVASWGFFLKIYAPKNQRIKTVAEGLIYSNVLMIILNMTAIHISPNIGLGVSILVLAITFLFVHRLPKCEDKAVLFNKKRVRRNASIKKSLAFLCLFIVIITINSGLMYQVLNPAFTHLEWLASWYWAIPYIVAIYIMRNLTRKTNRSYILYVAIAMIGFSFILFMILDRSVLSYLLVNTLMLGACGVYDLFWWSILGEMLDFNNNPAKVLGIGLSANVLGVLLGGLLGNTIASANGQSINSLLLALTVVCVTFIILPPLHKHLSGLLNDHAYLTVISAMVKKEQDKTMERFISIGQLTERESEIAALLFTGKTYRVIAKELHISENTVKTHIRNIYAKFEVKSRTELINIMLELQISAH